MALSGWRENVGDVLRVWVEIREPRGEYRDEDNTTEDDQTHDQGGSPIPAGAHTMKPLWQIELSIDHVHLAEFDARIEQ
jgi:hypothetical protein